MPLRRRRPPRPPSARVPHRRSQRRPRRSRASPRRGADPTDRVVSATPSGSVRGARSRPACAGSSLPYPDAGESTIDTERPDADPCARRRPGRRHGDRARRARCGQVPRRLRRRRDQGRGAGWGRDPPNGLDRPGRWRVVPVEARRAGQADDRPRPQIGTRPRRHAPPLRHRRRAGREPPTRQARGPRPGARGPPRAQPRARHPAGHRLRPGRSLRGSAGLRDPRRGDERVRRDQRGARRSAAPAAHRAHRRDRRARRRVRGDGRAPSSRPDRRGSGDRRQPARVDVADHGRAPERVRAPGLRATAARGRDPVLGAAGDVSMSRRRVGRVVDLGGECRRAGPRAARRGRRRAVRVVRGSVRASRRARGRGRRVDRGSRLGRRAPRLRRRSRRDRARLLDGRRAR